MAVTTEELLIRIVADQTEYLRDLKKMETAARKTGAAVQASGNQVVRASKSYNRMGNVAQQSAIQAGDFFVQIEAGQDAFRAFGQQASQVASFLTGPWGIAAQAASLAVLFFGKSLLEAIGLSDRLQPTLKSSTDAMDEYAKAVDAYAASVERANVPLAELRVEYGAQAEAVERLYDRKRTLDYLDTLDRMADNLKEQSGQYRDLNDTYEHINMLLEERKRTEEQIKGDVAEAVHLAGEMEDEYGATYEQISAIFGALEKIKSSGTPEELADNAAAAADEFYELFGTLDKVPGPLRDIVRYILDTEEATRDFKKATDEVKSVFDQVVALTRTLMSLDLAGWVSKAKFEASEFAKEMLAAANTFFLIQEMGMSPGDIDENGKIIVDGRTPAEIRAYNNSVGSGRGGDPRDYVDDPYWKGKYFPDPAKMDFSRPKTGGGSTKAGGAGSGNTKSAFETALELLGLDSGQEDAITKAIDDLHITNTELENMRDTFTGITESDLNSLVELLQEFGLSKDDAAAMAEALGQVTEEAEDLKEELMGIVESGIGSFFDQLSEDLIDGKADWRDYARVALEAIGDIANALITSSINSYIAGGGTSFLGAGAAAGAGFKNFGSSLLSGGASAGRIFNQPSMPLVGEMGPEAVVPLERGSNGKLGLKGGGSNVTINNYHSGADVQVTKQDGNNLEITIKAISSEVVRQVRNGGAIASAFEGTYGVARKGR